MTPREAERRRTQRQHALESQSLEDDRCLSFRQWCELNGIGLRTGRRILANGTGPTVTMLTDKRIGIRVIDNRRWQESRARG
jgi:hypothetical protein